MFSGGFGGFKFPGFGGGGFGGSGGDDDSAPQGGEKDNKLYEILGVETNATQDEIKKVYKKKCLKMHPDKGGDPEKFKEFKEAYEILSNPEKRDLYDKYGMDGLKEGGGPGGGMDLFEMFMGGGKKANKPKKAKPQLKEVKVTLEDVYHGKTIQIKVNRKRTCAECDGKGGKEEKTCSKCKGRGIIEKMVMLGPGMYSHSSSPCDDCKGEGKIIEEKNKCKGCKGQKVIEEKKELDVAVQPGVPHEYDYIMHGESDEYPGIMAGDIYARILIQKHKIFERKGADLFIEKQITLLEALTGFSFEIEHLDGEKYIIATSPGEIINPDQIKSVPGKGMPFWKDAMSHGNLHIKFKVLFPKKSELKPQAREELRKVLGAPKKGEAKKGENAEYLEDFNEDDLNISPEGGKGKKDDDDDGHHHEGTRVQCGQH